MCHELLCCFRGNDYDHARRDGPEENRSWDIKPPSTVNGSSNPSSFHANNDTVKPLSPFPQEKPKEMKLPDEVKAPSTINESSNSASLHANDDTEKSLSPFPQGEPKEMKPPNEFPMKMKPVGANHKDTEKTSSGPEEVSKKNESRVQGADKKDQISAKNVLPSKGFTANEEVPRKPAAFIYDK